MISKTKINKDTIANLSEDELDELVYNKASDLFLGTFGEYFKETSKDNLLKLVFITSLFDNECKNGGLDSFFTNYSNLSKFVIDGLRLLSAEKHLLVFEEACKIFEEGKSLENIRNIKFDRLDDLYFELDDIEIKRKKYVSENITDFID